jgi:Zn-dependent M32 family carboxypeptidase
LGNLYAASLGAKIQEEIPTLWTQVESGNFEEVLAWLRKNIHHRGHMAEAPVLVKDAVGERDSVADLVTQLRNRLGLAYGL